MRRIRSEKLALILSVSMGLLSAACGDSSESKADAGTDAGASTVEIFSWWTAPGEAEALQAVISLHKTKFPNVTVVNASSSDPNDVRDQKLQQRLGTNDQPDLFQVTPAKLPTIYVKNYPDSVKVLDTELTARGWDQVLFPGPTSDFKVNGKLYGIPTNLNRISGIYYNKQVFADAGVSVASITDWASFIAACDAIKAKGVAPIATAWSSQQGWILRILFDTMVLSTWGGDFFKAYYNGTLARDANGAISTQADIDKIKLGVDRFVTLIESYVNSDAADLDWDTAAQKVIDGTAAMFPHGDWAKGLYVQKNKAPGVDFDVFSPPGDPQKTFLYGVDGFSLATQGKNLTGALDFLDTFLSEAGQLAFCSVKGASPVRKNVNTGTLDAVAQKNAQAMGEATVTMQDPGEGWGYVDTTVTPNKTVTEDVALNTFVTTRATDAEAKNKLYEFFLSKAKKL